MTQRSQRMPLTWIVSVTTGTSYGIDRVTRSRADSMQPMRATDLELEVRLARRRIEAVERHLQLLAPAPRP